MISATSGSLVRQASALLVTLAGSPPTIQTPAPGSPLTGGQTLFTWSPGSGVTQYGIFFGTAATGAASCTGNAGTALSAYLPLPTANQTGYATLCWMSAGAWQTTNYRYTINSQPLQLSSSPVVAVPSSGKETMRTFTFGSGDPGTLILGACTTGSPSLTARVASHVGVAQIGFTAAKGTARQAVTVKCPTSGGAALNALVDIWDWPSIQRLSYDGSTLQIWGGGFGFAGVVGLSGGNGVNEAIPYWTGGVDGYIQVFKPDLSPGNYEVVVAVETPDCQLAPEFAEGGCPFECEVLESFPAEFSVAGQPTITITSRPIIVTPSSTVPGTYTATLTSVATPLGGSYNWSTNNSGMVGFSNTTPSSGPSADHVSLAILSTDDKATITLTYNGPYGGSATDSFTFALTNDTVAVAWVNGDAIIPDTSTMPLGAFDPIVLAMYQPDYCGSFLSSWASKGRNGQGGRGANELTDAERVWVNQFLMHNTGNSRPPSQLPDGDSLETGGAYRLYQRLQAAYEIVDGSIDPQKVEYLKKSVKVGTTPAPCLLMPSWIANSVESHQLNGSLATSSDHSLVYQINEARLGDDGQAINQYLNGSPGANYHQATPWIWTVIQFDANGKIRPWISGADVNNLQIFPAYEVYANGLGTAFAQGILETFISLSGNSQYGGPK
jgi:hypothetical protein